MPLSTRPSVATEKAHHFHSNVCEATTLLIPSLTQHDLHPLINTSPSGDFRGDFVKCPPREGKSGSSGVTLHRGRDTVLGKQKHPNFLEGKLLSFFRAIFHPELRSGLMPIFHLVCIRRARFPSQQLQWNYFLELELRPNKVMMSNIASFRCFPKR